MEFSQNSNKLFCHSIGSTLQILSFFTQARARLLLNSLSKFTREFYAKQENNIFRSCLPTVFSATINHERTVIGTEDRFIIRAIHLRDSLFVIGYASGLIAIKNLETGEVIDQIQIEGEEQPVMDVDIFNNDERHILVGYREEKFYFVNFQTRSVNPFECNLPSMLSMV